MTAAFRWLFEALEVAGARLPILTYHRVVPVADPLRVYDPDAAGFEKQMSWLGSTFRVLPLEEGIRRLRAGTLPRRSLAITFDDGYLDNLEVAVPILLRLGLHATFFLTSAYQDGGLMWNDRVIEALLRWPKDELDLTSLGSGTLEWSPSSGRIARLPAVLEQFKYLPAERREQVARELHERSGVSIPRLMLNPEEVRKLHHCGMGIGGHTHSHPILARIPLDSARDEIFSNKARLESLIGDRISLFAYPNGRPDTDYTAEHVALVREAGYDAAVSTAAGTASRGSCPWELPRFTPWDRTRSRFLARLASMHFEQGRRASTVTGEQSR